MNNNKTNLSPEEITRLGNPRKPQGHEGELMLERMNNTHYGVTSWALDMMHAPENACILDIGCGGGSTLNLLAHKYPDAKLYGIDYSPISVKKTREFNQKAIAEGRLRVTEGSVEEMPYTDCSFDAITTVESFYFWPDPVNDLKEVRRVLKEGGHFFLIADIYGREDLPESVISNIAEYELNNPTPDQFRELFKEAGFHTVNVHLREGTDWICVEGIRRTYDFTQIMDRSGKDAIAVDAIGADVPWAIAPSAPKEGFSKLPMWVADMNFPTAPTIQEEVIRRTAHPAFGYFAPTDEYYASIIDWHRTRNHVEGLTRKEIGYENGVLGCVCSAIQAFTSPGEKILLHSPTYIGFTHSLEDTGRTAELSPLVRDEDGVWRMDYEDMDRRLKRNRIHLAIFCSPHNPCGRVWEPWEIKKAMDVYRDNQCIVVSDEIWSDILLNGHKHTTTQSISEDAKNRTIAVYAPSKTFNLAGLIGSYHVIYNPYLRDRVKRTAACSHYNDMNVLSMHALIGAYKPEGHQWLDRLNEVLSENINYAYDYIKSHFHGISVAKPEGTYMMFLHCEEYCKKHNLSIDQLIKAGWDVGVAWQQGAPFHDPWAIRMNFALPFSLVQEAMDRLSAYVFNK